MNVEPRDLDIVVKKDNLSKISKIFSDYNASDVKKLKSLTDKPAWEVSVIINNIEIQFIAGLDNDVYVSNLLDNKIITIRIGDMKVPCFMLEAEIDCYEKTGRKEKADMIREFINTKR